MDFPNNLVRLFLDKLRQNGDKPFLYHKQAGAYEGISYGTCFERISALAHAFQNVGVRAGTRVAILSGNRPEWPISDLAILCLGAVNVPLYPSLGAEDIRFILVESGCEAIVLESRDHLDKVQSIGDQCPQLKVIVVLDEGVADDSVLDFEAFLSEGAKKRFSLEEIELMVGNLESSQLASIIYTSGTTGRPKGVALTHGNFLSNARDICEIIPLYPTDSVLSFLPLCHVFERTVGYYTMLAAGASIYYATDKTTVAADMILAQPTILVSVPRLYEKIQAKIVGDLSGLKETIFYWALGVGKAYRTNPDAATLGLKLKLKLADRLVYSKIRAKTGGHLRFFVSGGAPLAKSLGEFFWSLGLLIIEGYGLTETSPVIACNRLTEFKFGTVGLPLPQVEVKLGDDGELLAKGPSIMAGYYNNETATSEVLGSDGWFKTGDIAEIDSDGYVRIVDRKKELIVLSTGKNVPPLVIENRLIEDPYINQVIIIGDQQKFITALVVPDFQKLGVLASERKLAGQSVLTLIKSPEIRAFYEERISVQLASFSSYMKVKKFTLLQEEFSEAGGELTPTLKMKRKVIVEKNKSRIAEMYAENSPAPVA
ncbi:MAG: long-chain acyl-CoA synthetase [Candidatus Marinamargulisbacteria bacterium]|jgi:long-chain acyl-CoA synthetase